MGRNKGIFSNRLFHTIFGASISAIMLWWVISSVDLQETAKHLKAIHLWPLIPASFVFLLHFVLRAVRWRFLLPNGGQFRFAKLFDSIMIGNLANFIFPLRAGEFVRPLVFSRATKTSFISGFTSLITERFFDLFFVLLSFFLLVKFVGHLDGWVVTGAYILAAVALVTLIVVALCAFAPAVMEKLNSVLLRVIPERFHERERSIFREFMTSASVIRRWQNSLGVLGYSSLVWASNYLLFYVFLFMFDIEPSASLAITIGVITALAVAAPSAPGFIGVYQAACTVSFVLFGLSEEIAVAYSVVTHVFQYVVFIGYGIFALWRMQLSPRALSQMVEGESVSN